MKILTPTLAPIAALAFSVAAAIAATPREEIAAKVPAARAILDGWQAQNPQTAERKLHVVLWTPNDREPAPQYRERLTAILHDIRDFNAKEMERVGFGPRTLQFAYAAGGLIDIHLVRGRYPYAHYNVDSGTEIRNECLAPLRAAGIEPEQETIAIFCNMANWNPGNSVISQNSPYYGGGTCTNGTAWVVDSPILNLDLLTMKQPMVNDGQYGYISVGRYNTIFIGGICHELGHALGLPHNLERADERAEFGTALMGSGNQTYGEERRGEGKGSFLTLASAMRLASHPIFCGSVKGINLPARATPTELAIKPEGKGFTFSGQVSADPPVYGVVAYMDPDGGGDYDATTATAVPDPDGKFVLHCQAVTPGKAAQLRVVFLQANGVSSGFPSYGLYTYTVNTAGTADVSAIKASIGQKTFGNFEYVDNGSSITITNYPDNATGSVVIPTSIDGKPVTRIGNYAFDYCTGLISITIPSSVMSIGSEAFYGCTGFSSVTIPSSVTSIGESAFYGCTGLTSVSIPSDVSLTNTFPGCTGLANVMISPGATSIGDKAFKDYTSLTSVTIPSSVKSIGKEAFFGCTGLTSVTIPSSVTSFGDNAFSGCTGLASATIGSKSIGDYAFDSCTDLTSVTISAGVTNIGEWAFYGCTGLTSVVIPSSVTSLGKSAFYDCTGLTSVTIPSSVTILGVGSFYGCTGLASATIGSKSIGNQAFSLCTGLTSVTISSNVMSIGSYVFDGCSGLASVTIPSSVTSIGQAAFRGCFNLSKTTFLGNAPAMGGVGSWFESTAPSFKIYFNGDKTGFTVPTWQGYPSVRVYDRPEISIQQPAGSELVDGTAKKSFGSVLVNNKSLPKSFTIKNVGTKTLTGLSVTINGLNAKDFIVTQPLKTSLAGGTSTTFKVFFKPLTKGTKNAAIHIRSNDANENPFDIMLVGLGMQ